MCNYRVYFDGITCLFDWDSYISYAFSSSKAITIQNGQVMPFSLNLIVSHQDAPETILGTRVRGERGDKY